MAEMTLAMSPDELPASGGAIWEGRSSSEGVIAIEEALEQRLLQIRTEHMQWAYTTGQTKLENGKSFQSCLECGSLPSMWWLSLIYERHPKLSPNLYLVYKLRCLELLLLESGSGALHLKGGNWRLRKILARLCKDMNIAFRYSPGKKARPNSAPNLCRRLYALAPAPARALARFFHWWLTIRRKLAPVKALPQLTQGAPAATIATYFPNLDMRAAAEGRFRSRYWEKLHDALNEEAQRERPDGPHFVRWLLIRFPSPDLSFAQCRKLRDRFQREGRDGLSFNFLEEFLYTGDLFAALRRWLELCLQSIRLQKWFARNCGFKGSALNFWPLMKAEWKESMAGWRCLERCLFNRAFRNYCRLAGQQRWTLFPLENCPWERMLTVAAREIQLNGPVYGAQHSTVRPTDFRYFDDPATFEAPDCKIFQPDVIAGNGDSACQQWLANGMPKGRLRKVEALRYLYLANANPDQELTAKSALPPQEGEPVEQGPGMRLLILTSFFEDETRAHLELVRLSLNAHLLDDYRLVLKPHPYLLPEAWLASLPEAQRSRIFVSHAPLALELAARTIVWASNSTTASLEAALKQLPLMVMAADNDFDLCPIQDIKGLARTGTLEDVKKHLEKLEPLRIEPGYLCLDPGLKAWKMLLDLKN